MHDMDLSYILNEYAEDRDEYFRAIAPPIIQTSNFAFKKVNDMRKSFENEYSTWMYSRGLNPTVEILRKKLAALDGAEDCLVFNSGASAIFCSVLANVKSGDHVVCVRHPYTWAKKMFNEILPRFNVTTTYVDGRDVKNFEAATKENTTLYYLESPNSWMFELQDLKAVAALAKQHNIITICDNSFSTPLYQKPIEYGIDLVLQSATKFISGHSDTVAGVLSGSRKMIEKIFNSEFLNTGSGITPFNAWLLIRGLRTLPLRLERVTNTTNRVVAYLKQHPLVEKIVFAFDEDFEQYELAKQQMKGACGLLSFYLKESAATSISTIEKFCESLKHILMAVSWGGHESLIIPGCASIKPEQFNAANPSHRMFRLYCGLEDAEYIIADLDQALSVVANLK